MLNIYVANLGKYNEGYLVGEWLELPYNGDFDEWLDKKIGVSSNTEYEEYAIHDYESDYEDFEISEYSNLTELNELAERLENIENTYDKKVINTYIEYYGDFEEALEKLEGNDVIYYYAESFEDLACQFVDEGLYGDIPDSIINYLDYEKIGRDLSLDGYYEGKHGVIIYQY